MDSVDRSMSSNVVKYFESLATEQQIVAVRKYRGIGAITMVRVLSQGRSVLDFSERDVITKIEDFGAKFFALDPNTNVRTPVYVRSVNRRKYLTTNPDHDWGNKLDSLRRF